MKCPMDYPQSVRFIARKRFIFGGSLFTWQYSAKGLFLKRRLLPNTSDFICSRSSIISGARLEGLLLPARTQPFVRRLGGPLSYQKQALKSSLFQIWKRYYQKYP